MPNQADIVVKKANGSTDITYVKVQGAAGESSPAVWNEPTTGNVRGGYPSLQVKARKNGTKSRRLDSTFVYPKVREDANGNYVVGPGVTIQVSSNIQMDMTDAEINEAIAQGLNLCASAHYKDQASSGYAAT
jgi:hypothetical protein